MFIRRMVDDQIHYQLHTAFMDTGEHFVKIAHRPKLFHNGTVVADIITVVVIWRPVNGGKPNDIHAQFFQIIQLGCNSL